MFRCKDCDKKFSNNFGFERLKATPEAVTASMNLYFNGESLRHVANSMKLFGVKVTHKTIENWIKKYVKLMEKYLAKITPQVSDKWRTDELYLKIKGDRKYLYAMMDDQTRWWIASQVSNTKYTEDVRPLFKKSRDVAGKKPKVLVSDGARNFMEAHKKEWYSRYKEDTTKHIRHIHFKNDYNNNKMERLNGEIRDGEKTMRGLKKDDSAIITGMRIHHNYIRPHMALSGQTPQIGQELKLKERICGKL
ncbi:MAG: IS6 family transposase [Nitrosopumilaceae archaeon]|nr:IS6 family transposase [Nitrosopumilaceae archaeon]